MDYLPKFTVTVPEGYSVEIRLLDPRALLSDTYGFAEGDHESTAEEAELEAYRKDIKERQLHRFHVSLLSPDRHCKALRSAVFPPGDESAQLAQMQEAVDRCIAAHRNQTQPA